MLIIDDSHILSHPLCSSRTNLFAIGTSLFNTEISVPLALDSSDLSLVLILLEFSTIGGRRPPVAVSEGNDRAKKYRARTVRAVEWVLGG